MGQWFRERIMQSVLDRATPADISDDPFPHLVVRRALDDELYERLASEFPRPGGGMKQLEPGKFACQARAILAEGRLSPTWRAFVAHHVSAEFFRRVLALFGDRIRTLHPDLENRLGKRLEDLRPGVRFADGRNEISLEAQCIYSEASDQPAHIIGPHLDRPVALYAGLFYFRVDGDDSTGADLELYRWKPGFPAYLYGVRQVPDHLVEVVKVIRYEKNTLVFFPHSSVSIHGVSIRSAAPFPRRHVNLVGEFEMSVYDLSRYPVRSSLGADLAGGAGPSESRGSAAR
jgi:hypothetical protein